MGDKPLQVCKRLFDGHTLRLHRLGFGIDSFKNLHAVQGAHVSHQSIPHSLPLKRNFMPEIEGFLNPTNHRCTLSFLLL